MKIEIIYSSVVAAGILSWHLIGLDPQTFGLLTNKISESLLKLLMRTVSRLTTKIRRKLLHFTNTCFINVWQWNTPKFCLLSSKNQLFLSKSNNE